MSKVTHFRRRLALIAICLGSLALAEVRADGPGDPLPRISCSDNFSAYIYAENLSSPDGLAWGTDGQLYVAEESANEISQISASGTVTTFASGIISPEGIAFAPDGTLYAVEDIENGRLVAIDSAGVVTGLLSNLDAPEGVAVHPNGSIYITQSNVQFTGDPFSYLSRVTAVTPAGNPTDISLIPFFRSYSGITVGPGGDLFVANEAAGVGPDASVYRLDPDTLAIERFAEAIPAAEGLNFQHDGSFPFILVEEDRGSGDGYLHRIAEDKSSSEFCSGFFAIEDVLVAPDGNIYVSEDGSGYVVQLRRTLEENVYLPIVTN